MLYGLLYCVVRLVLWALSGEMVGPDEVTVVMGAAGGVVVVVADGGSCTWAAEGELAGSVGFIWFSIVATTSFRTADDTDSDSGFWDESLSPFVSECTVSTGSI